MILNEEKIDFTLDKSLKGYKSYNDRLKELPEDKINKIIEIDKDRKSCDWELSPVSIPADFTLPVRNRKPLIPE